MATMMATPPPTSGQLLLRWREKQWERFSPPFASLAIEGVLPQPLDEGAEGKNVRCLPDAQALRTLEGVEFEGESLRKPAVRGDDRDAGGMAFGEPDEKVGLRKWASHARQFRGSLFGL